MSTSLEKLVFSFSLLVTTLIPAAQQQKAPDPAFTPALMHLKSTFAAYLVGNEAKGYMVEGAKRATTYLRSNATVDSAFSADLTDRCLTELGVLDPEKCSSLRPAFEAYFAGRVQRTNDTMAQQTLKAALATQVDWSPKQDQVVEAFFNSVAFNGVAAHKRLEKAFERALGALIKEGVIVPTMANKELIALFETGTKFSLLSKLSTTPYGTLQLPSIAQLKQGWSSFSSSPVAVYHDFHLHPTRYSGTGSMCGAQDPFCFHNSPYRAQPLSWQEGLLKTYLRLCGIAASVVATWVVLQLSHEVTVGVLSKADARVARFMNKIGALYWLYATTRKAAEKFIETYSGGLLFYYGREYFYSQVRAFVEQVTGRPMTIEEEYELRAECDWWERLMFAYEAGAFGGQKEALKRFGADLKNMRLN